MLFKYSLRDDDLSGSIRSVLTDLFVVTIFLLYSAFNREEFQGRTSCLFQDKRLQLWEIENKVTEERVNQQDEWIK